MQFEKVERPKVQSGRAGEPNPYLDVVKDLAANGEDSDAVAFTLSGDEIGEKREKNSKGEKLDPPQYVGIEKARRQLREAGTAAGVTVRSTVDHNVKAKTARVAFWTTEKRTRKTADAAAPEATGAVEGTAPSA